MADAAELARSHLVVAAVDVVALPVFVVAVAAAVAVL